MRTVGAPGHAEDAPAARAPSAAGRWSPEETAVVRALAPLASRGWTLLVDRCLPDRTRLAHLLVGPVGAAVVDVAVWDEPISLRDGRLVSGGTDRERAVDRVLTESAWVLAAVSDTHPHVRVGGLLALAGDHDRARPPAEHRDVILTGIETMYAVVERAQDRLGTVEVASLVATLDWAFPPAGFREVESFGFRTGRAAGPGLGPLGPGSTIARPAH